MIVTISRLPQYFRGPFPGISRFQSAISQVFLRSHMSIFQVLRVIPPEKVWFSRFKINTNFSEISDCGKISHCEAENNGEKISDF